jgi:hypothetical protein
LNGLRIFKQFDFWNTDSRSPGFVRFFQGSSRQNTAKAAFFHASTDVKQSPCRTDGRFFSLRLKMIENNDRIGMVIARSRAKAGKYTGLRQIFILK